MVAQGTIVNKVAAKYAAAFPDVAGWEARAPKWPVSLGVFPEPEKKPAATEGVEEVWRPV